MLTKQVEEPWLLFCFDGFFFLCLKSLSHAKHSTCEFGGSH